jgi:multidrug resistance efflux pump
MIDIKRYQALKRAAEDAKSESDKAQGAFEQMTARLKSEFGCDSFDDAKKLLKKLEEEMARREREFDKALAEFEEKYPHVLEV